MDFQILSHASLVVRGAGLTLLIDPWLVGSCYWRSWWNYPPVDPALIENLTPDAIYLTHVHWDHFHGASLRKFSKDTRMLIPYERSPRVRKDLQKMGFNNIIELDHGKSMQLAPGFDITSYQFASPWGDSALVVETEGVTILDANDTKFMGWPLDQILKRHPAIDFALRSHSSANDRACVQYTDATSEGYGDDPDEYIKSFCQFMNKVRPRYAVPFASNHCHLHKDVFDYNKFIMTPERVRSYIEGQGGLEESELKIMLTGDSWDSDKGFDIKEHTYFSDRDSHLRKYRDENAEKLEKTYEKEARTKLELKHFQKFFGRFFEAVPGYRRRELKGKPMIFKSVTPGETRYFLVDIYEKRVSEISEADLTEAAMIFEAPAAILKHAMAMNMFAHAGISKRVVYRCRREDINYYNRFKQLLAAYEYDAIPMSQLFSLRTLRSYLPRWREVLLYARVLYSRKRGKTLREIEADLMQ